jgi:hypothetical protein
MPVGAQWDPLTHYRVLAVEGIQERVVDSISSSVLDCALAATHSKMDINILFIRIT